VCGTWSPTLREGHRLKVFDTRTLKRIFSPFDWKYEETGENFIIRSFLILTLSQDYSDDEVQDNKMGVACSTYEEQQCIRIYYEKNLTGTVLIT